MSKQSVSNWLCVGYKMFYTLFHTLHVAEFAVSHFTSVFRLTGFFLYSRSHFVQCSFWPFWYRWSLIHQQQDNVYYRTSSVELPQCFSTAVPRKLRVPVPPVVSKGSVGQQVLSKKIRLCPTFAATRRVFSRLYCYTVWSAIGSGLLSVRLFVCNAVHCGSQVWCIRLKLSPAWS